jgi:mannitol 2-dehydrogenase
MENTLVRDFLAKLTRSEIIPTVPPPPRTDLEQYRELIARRFANPKIGDTVSRLCLDGSNRQPKFILPTVVDRLKEGRGVRGLALVSALWCRYCYGETESGQTIAPNDANWARLQAAARLAKDDPRKFLEMRDIFGALSQDPTYVAVFSDALSQLWARGVGATLTDYLSDPS